MRLMAIALLLGASAFGQVTYSGTVSLSGSTTGGASTTGTGCGAGYSSGPFEFKFIRAVNSNQSNFPIRITGRDPRFATTGNGGNVQHVATNSLGRTNLKADWVWCNAASGGTALKFEPVQYTATYGDYEDWLQQPTYHSASDDSAYLFVGKSSVTTVQEDLSMWCDINYQTVLHHPDGSTLDLLNSGCLGGSVTNNNTVAAKGGAFGGGAYFDDTNRSLEIADSSTLRPSSALSLETWISSFQYNSDRPIISKPFRNSGGWSSPYFSYALHMIDGKIGTHITVAGVRIAAVSSSPMDSHSWNLVSGTYDSANSAIKTYINGSNVATATQTGSIDYNGGITSDPNIGVESSYVNVTGEYLKGVVDETRIATDIKTPDWYETAAQSGKPSCSNYQIQDSTFAVPTISQFCSNALLAGGESVALPFTAGTNCTFGGSANCVIHVSVTMDDASSCPSTLSGTPYSPSLVEHSYKFGTLHSYQTCAYEVMETATASVSITAPSFNNSMTVVEIKGATTTGMVTASAGNTDQPTSMSGTSPAANTLMLCMVRGNDTPEYATIDGVTIPASSTANLFGQYSQADHYSVVHLAYALVGSGTKACTLESGPGGVMVMLPKI